MFDVFLQGIVQMISSYVPSMQYLAD
jgi:hypothetical protein